ncbi:MAG: cryptochrome/photolyase family protein [Thermoflavifilum sp.]|nr:cryptochrome/photolyase family protein [Thermoflavifilum sp.]
MEAVIIFPHQLYQKHPALHPSRKVLLIEEYLFFKQYRFHLQKLSFHRCSMKDYAHWLVKQGYAWQYIPFENDYADIRKAIPHLIESGYEALHIAYVDDDWLEQRIMAFSTRIRIHWYDHPGFLLTRNEIATLFPAEQKHFQQTSFYVAQRKRFSILMEHQKPTGGKWTFDQENRKPLPSKIQIPAPLQFSCPSLADENLLNLFWKNQDYAAFPGYAYPPACNQWYPTTHQQAKLALQDFLENRLHYFGPYQDAISPAHDFLFHSLLSPLLNTGLLTPQEVIAAVVDYSKAHPEIPISSVEAFIRQIIGWREFIRALYLVKGKKQRSSNYWKHEFPLPRAFYTATTGITPVDDCIRKLQRTAYCHHIERLMILGNFMLLCEIHPDGVYQWFMEMFIDAYDWVMVPNVYGMSQFADGGMMSTKPYFSSSHYLLRMSNYKKDKWCNIWDALFWRFVSKHQNTLQYQPRWRYVVSNCQKMPKHQLNYYLQKAAQYLSYLHGV